MMAAENYGNRTKEELDRALRRLLARKPLAQVRVRELTELCGIRRQSFYYHFDDVNQLFDWSVARERTRLCRRQERCVTWQQALEDLLAHVARQRDYYRALLENRGREGLRQVFQEAVSPLLARMLAYYRQRCGGGPDDDGDRLRLSCWETIWFSLIEGWLRDGQEEPEAVIGMMEELMRQGAVGVACRQLARQGFGFDPNDPIV
jgi:AcrR family transcriptional regulator